MKKGTRIHNQLPWGLKGKLRATAFFVFSSPLPRIEPALKALELLGGRPEEALFIGDAIFDIKCGAAAGLHTCYISYVEGPYPHEDNFPTYHIGNLRELLLWPTASNML